MVTDSHDLSVERFSPGSSLRHDRGSGNPGDPNVIWTGVPTESTGNRRCVSGGDVSLETVADHHEDPREPVLFEEAVRRHRGSRKAEQTVADPPGPHPADQAAESVR